MSVRTEIIGDATLWNADCRDVLADIGKVGSVLTDPPYGIAYASGHATDALWEGRTIHGDATTALRDEVLTMLPAVPTLVFGSWRAPRPAGTRSRLIWDSGPALGMGALDIPWKPSDAEIYVLHRGFVGARDCGSTIYCPPVQSMAKNGRQHPNEKPVGLLCLLLAKMPPGTLLDPFMGSGSCGVAAAKTDRPFIGVEIEPRYFDIACRRITEAQRQGDMFRDAPKPAPKQGVLL